VGIGDSYESGEGMGGYLPETDADYPSYTWNACRRSTNAWPRQLVLPGASKSIGAFADGFDVNVDFQFVACSGAPASAMRGLKSTYYWTQPSSDMDPFHGDAEGEFNERAQIDSGVLSDDTTLVLLSAGGNDANFPNVLRDCAIPNCATAANKQTYLGYI